MENLSNEILYGFIGMVIALIGRFLWDKLSKTYVTEIDFKKVMKEHMNGCEARKILSDTKLNDKVTVIQKVVLELAIKAGISIDQFKDLTR